MQTSMETPITNSDRTEWAQHALNAYSEYKEGAYELYDLPETVLVDLLADLMHYCTTNGISFEESARTALMHYDAELVDGEDGVD